MMSVWFGGFVCFGCALDVGALDGLGCAVVVRNVFGCARINVFMEYAT